MGNARISYPASRLLPELSSCARVRWLRFEVKGSTPLRPHAPQLTAPSPHALAQDVPAASADPAAGTSSSHACLSWWLHRHSQPRLVRAKLPRRGHESRTPSKIHKGIPKTALLSSTSSFTA